MTRTVDYRDGGEDLVLAIIEELEACEVERETYELNDVVDVDALHRIMQTGSGVRVAVTVEGVRLTVTPAGVRATP